MIAARASKLTLMVHAVDDTGSLCGARPKGDWVEEQRIPITCPRCLWRYGRPRYAICDVPQARRDRPMHIRLVGPEGVQKRSGLKVKTLCGLPVGWDIGELRSPVPTQMICQHCRRILVREGDLDTANAVSYAGRS